MHHNFLTADDIYYILWTKSIINMKYMHNHPWDRWFHLQKTRVVRSSPNGWKWSVRRSVGWRKASAMMRCCKAWTWPAECTSPKGWRRSSPRICSAGEHTVWCDSAFDPSLEPKLLTKKSNRRKEVLGKDLSNHKLRPNFNFHFFQLLSDWRIPLKIFKISLSNKFKYLKITHGNSRKKSTFVPWRVAAQ